MVNNRASETRSRYLCQNGHPLYKCPRCNGHGCMWDGCTFGILMEYSEFGRFEDPYLCVHCKKGEHGGEYIRVNQILDIATAGDLLKNNRSFRDFIKIEPGVAELLSKFSGTLWLDGIKSLMDDDCTTLARHNGAIILNGIKSLNDNQIRALSKHNGPVILEGLTDFPPTSSKTLIAKPFKISNRAKNIAQGHLDNWFLTLTEIKLIVGEQKYHSVIEHETAQTASQLADEAMEKSLLILNNLFENHEEKLPFRFIYESLKKDSYFNYLYIHDFEKG